MEHVDELHSLQAAELEGREETIDDALSRSLELLTRARTEFAQESALLELDHLPLLVLVPIVCSLSLFCLFFLSTVISPTDVQKLGIFGMTIRKTPG